MEPDPDTNRAINMESVVSNSVSTPEVSNEAFSGANDTKSNGANDTKSNGANGTQDSAGISFLGETVNQPEASNPFAEDAMICLQPDWDIPSTDFYNFDHFDIGKEENKLPSTVTKQEPVDNYPSAPKTDGITEAPCSSAVSNIKKEYPVIDITDEPTPSTSRPIENLKRSASVAIDDESVICLGAVKKRPTRENINARQNGFLPDILSSIAKREPTVMPTNLAEHSSQPTYHPDEFAIWSQPPPVLCHPSIPGKLLYRCSTTPSESYKIDMSRQQANTAEQYAAHDTEMPDVNLEHFFDDY